MHQATLGAFAHQSGHKFGMRRDQAATAACLQRFGAHSATSIQHESSLPHGADVPRMPFVGADITRASKLSVSPGTTPKSTRDLLYRCVGCSASVGPAACSDATARRSDQFPKRESGRGSKRRGLGHVRDIVWSWFGPGFATEPFNAQEAKGKSRTRLSLDLIFVAHKKSATSQLSVSQARVRGPGRRSVCLKKRTEQTTRNMPSNSRFHPICWPWDKKIQKSQWFEYLPEMGRNKVENILGCTCEPNEHLYSQIPAKVFILQAEEMPQILEHNQEQALFSVIGSHRPGLDFTSLSAPLRETLVNCKVSKWYNTGGRRACLAGRRRKRGGSAIQEKTMRSAGRRRKISMRRCSGTCTKAPGVVNYTGAQREVVGSHGQKLPSVTLHWAGRRAAKRCTGRAASGERRKMSSMAWYQVLQSYNDATGAGRRGQRARTIKHTRRVGVDGLGWAVIGAGRGREATGARGGNGGVTRCVGGEEDSTRKSGRRHMATPGAGGDGKRRAEAGAGGRREAAGAPGGNGGAVATRWAGQQRQKGRELPPTDMYTASTLRAGHY
ncbi:hypothetical protein B0H13DRAFT_1851426 [Mycena leptocephala]|nr:hypothetical protein B0H13DRAFT_1851426 [Mycena leptocephala]